MTGLKQAMDQPPLRDRHIQVIYLRTRSSRYAMPSEASAVRVRVASRSRSVWATEKTGASAGNW